MEDYYLILYLGNDYIIPLIDSNRGNFFRYRGNSDSRIWLYFHEDIDSTDVLYGQDYYRPARMGTASYFGEYWKNIEANKQISIHGVGMPYVELAKCSRIVNDLREWYRSIIHTQQGDIPVVCTYSDTVPVNARKTFMGMLEENGFAIRSYSLSFNRLIARYCNLRPEYGKQIVFVTASGDKVQLLSMIYWNDEFVSCGNVETIEYTGEDPVKMALVQHIVDTNNRQTGFFTHEQLQREYAYQMQYATEWLDIARKAKDDESFLITYHLSLDPTVSYQINIRKSFIITKQEEAANPIIKGISRYCNQIGDANILQYIFTGDVFADEEMFRMASRTAPAKSVYIDSAYYGDILHLYSKHYLSLIEPLNDFDANMEQRNKEHDSASAWFRLAERITDIARRVSDFEPQAQRRLQDFAQKVETDSQSISSSLSSSNFDGAQQTLNALSNSMDELKIFISQSVHGLLNEHVCNRAIYDQVLDYVYARQIISEINRKITSIEQLVEKYEERVKLVGQLQENINYYRENYQRYLTLRREFDNATTLIDKRRLLEQMRPLTGETLPDDPSNVNPVVGRLSAKVNYKSGFLGLGKKPTDVEIHVTLGNQTLPYHCVVVVSDGPVSRINRDKVCFDLDRGTTGNVTFNVSLPNDKLPGAKQLTIRIMVDTEQEMMADIANVSFNVEYIDL